MIHITGMGILGSFLAWELHNRAVPFTWYDSNSPVNAWQACTGCIFPTGDKTDMENYCTWLTRLDGKTPWQEALGQSFLEEASYWFITAKPPHKGNYEIIQHNAPLFCAVLPSLHFNAQKFVPATRKYFAKQFKLPIQTVRDEEIVAHGFDYRLKEYVWGWTVPVKLSYPEGYNNRFGKTNRPCLYMRNGSFFQYAYPMPGTYLWYAGSSLIKSGEPKDYEIAPKIQTWLKWLEKFTNGQFSAKVAGEPMRGWRPRGGPNDGEEAKHCPGFVKDSRFPIYVRPHWHDGVRNGPSIVAALLEKAGIE